ncbi:hypothetical protein PI23P_01235 [Polaribacter irgensii 23-P]|uniref:Uncharacterized protein n=1 Tax=Polaribacter irgensii 23-P TaxID=313594 RepID=A4C2I4_9FLAO|nr:hypothetical protein [Polaribacter irgensii]EAR11785.1 hypothetical protein PI23P_01235 [Polaribacter irgensii 23-P]
MVFKKTVFLIIVGVVFCACSQDSDLTIARNLQEYIAENTTVSEGTVLAWAANEKGNTNVAYIYYHPEVGASDFRYYELKEASLEVDNFLNYERKSLENSVVYEAKLNRFSRLGSSENWCLVTYKKDGGLQISAPIKLKSQTKTTVYTSDVQMSYKTTLEPNFSWDDAAIDDNTYYFQTISDETNMFISGTFTQDTFFQYYDTANVLVSPNLNIETPKILVADEIYNFMMMGIGSDNWVNIIVEEQFIPRNLDEYVSVNSEKEITVTRAFAGTANGNNGETYIYFEPIGAAFDFRYYETEDATVSPDDFSNYKRRSLAIAPQFGGAFQRFSHNSGAEVWCLVTYISEGKLYVSAPIRTKNQTRPTEWKTTVTIDYSTILKPVFSWLDGSYAESETYFQVFTKKDATLLSGTFTVENTFQFYNESNIIDKIHSGTPEALVLDENYKFFLYGLSSDNWINIVIQNIFIAQ